MARFAAALLAAFLAAVVSAAPAYAQSDAPILSVGDYWTYRTNSTVAESFSFDGETTFTVLARGPSLIAGSASDVYRVAVRGGGSVTGGASVSGFPVSVSGSWSLNGEEEFEADGLKVTYSFLDLRADGVAQPFAQKFLLHVVNTTIFVIRSDTWRFPIDVGSTGSVTRDFNTTEEGLIRYGSAADTWSSNGTGRHTVDYVVESLEPISVAAGTYDAYRVNETWPDGRHAVSHFAPVAGNDLLVESYNASDERVARSELKSFRYQALEPARFLGLSADLWAAVGAGAAVSGLLAWSIHRRRRPRSPPE